MKKSNIIPGLILVFLGAFLLLNNLDLIKWSIFEVFFDLWPLILIAIGASIVFNDKKTIKTLIWVGFFVIIIAYGFYLQYISYNLLPNTRSYSNSWGSNSNSSSNISYEDEGKVKTALLDLELAGADLKIGSSDTVLLDGNVANPYVERKIDYLDGGQNANIVFKEQIRNRGLFNDKYYKSSFYLSDKIIWDINGDIGAVNGDIDLRNLKVNNLDMDFGAGDLKLLLGSNVENLDIDVDAGATNINILIPKDLGLKVNLSGGLKHSNLKDLNWKQVNGWYVSPNYDTAPSKASVNIDMGVGNLEVNVE